MRINSKKADIIGASPESNATTPEQPRAQKNSAGNRGLRALQGSEGPLRLEEKPDRQTVDLCDALVADGTAIRVTESVTESTDPVQTRGWCARLFGCFKRRSAKVYPVNASSQPIGESKVDFRPSNSVIDMRH